MKAKELIQDAFDKAGITDVTDEVEGVDMKTGLTLLNDIITQWSSLAIYIPTFNTISVTLQDGVSEYLVSPLIVSLLEAHLVDSSNVDTLLTQADSKKQNGFNYSLSSSRPGYIYLEPRYQLIDVTTEEPSSAVWFYPTPDAAYTAKLMVKQMLSELTYSTDITDVPKYYYRALKFELAAELSDSYGTTLSPMFVQKHQQIIKQLKAANQKDLTAKNSNPFIGSRFYRPWGYYGY